jgi:hypothetical protein
MLRGSANNRLEESIDLRDAILEIVEDIDVLSDRRNKLIHATYATLHQEGDSQVVIPHVHTGNRRASELAAKIPDGDLLDEVRGLRADIDRILDRCDEAYQRTIDHAVTNAERNLSSGVSRK